MSAPDTKALPPAPVITTTRTSSSAAKPSMIRLAASHMSSDTALWRSGLLKVMYPTCPSLRDSILSVWVMRRTPLLVVMAGHSRSKNGVASLAYVPAIHVLSRGTEDVDARHKAGHDEVTFHMAHQIAFALRR